MTITDVGDAQIIQGAKIPSWHPGLGLPALKDTSKTTTFISRIPVVDERKIPPRKYTSDCVYISRYADHTTVFFTPLHCGASTISGLRVYESMQQKPVTSRNYRGRSRQGKLSIHRVVRNGIFSCFNIICTARTQPIKM